jgi:hypothetical protein
VTKVCLRVTYGWQWGEDQGMQLPARGHMRMLSIQAGEGTKEAGAAQAVGRMSPGLTAYVRVWSFKAACKPGVCI